jgi:tRNA (guanine-N7-)-methyltransferase
MPRDATAEELERLDAFAALDEGPLDPTALFGNSRPVELEIGTGKGRFLAQNAAARPETNFLGIERSRKFFRRTAGAVVAAGATNVRLLSVDAALIVRTRLRPASIAAVHIYYPDPWPKRRHARRRIFAADFPAALARILVPGGMLYFQTDVDWYFRSTAEQFGVAPEFEIVFAGEAGSTPDGPATPGTHWEVKSRKAGARAYRIEARRRA